MEFSNLKHLARRYGALYVNKTVSSMNAIILPDRDTKLFCDVDVMFPRLPVPVCVVCTRIKMRLK